jgi:hypothetical protein
MCILPAHPAQHWSSVSDAYGVNVWDIYPACQIAGVCSDDTVLVDGAFGATIHWDKFQKVANTRRKRSWKRLAIQTILHGAPHYFVIGMVLFRAGWDVSNIFADLSDVISDGLEKKGERWALFFECIGFILIAMACFVFVSSPYLTRLLYGGRFCKYNLRCNKQERRQFTNSLFQGAHKRSSSALKGTSISRQSSPRFLAIDWVASAGHSTGPLFHATARMSSAKVLAWTRQRTH